jgi:polar amino acid transport system permease protein
VIGEFLVAPGYQFNFRAVIENYPFLLAGLKLTVIVTVFSMALSLVLGLCLALARLSSRRWLSVPTRIYIEVFRGTPFLVQILWIFYAMPLVLGLKLPPVQSAIVAVGLNGGAFCGEIIRAGILAVNRGQREAALSLGMSGWQALRRVILPQAFRTIVPPLGSVWVGLFKDTSLVSAITVTELFHQAEVVAIRTYRPMEVYTVVALIYFLLTWPQARFVDLLFDRWRVRT